MVEVEFVFGTLSGIKHYNTNNHDDTEGKSDARDLAAQVSVTVVKFMCVGGTVVGGRWRVSTDLI